MLILKRFSIFFIPILIFISFFLLFFGALWYYYLLLINIIIILFSLWYLLGQRVSLFDFLNFLFCPLAFFVGSFLFFTFLESVIVKVIILFFVPIFIFIYYNKLFKEFYNKPLWQINSFKYLIYYSQIIALWFLASSFFGLIIFINLSTYLVLGLLIVILIIFFNQFNWLAELTKAEKTWLVYLIFFVIFLENIFILNLLPLNLYFKGLFLTTIYYLFCQGYQLSQKNSLGLSKYLWKNLIIVIIILLLTLLAGNYF